METGAAILARMQCSSHSSLAEVAIVYCFLNRQIHYKPLRLVLPRGSKRRHRSLNLGWEDRNTLTHALREYHVVDLDSCSTEFYVTHTSLSVEPSGRAR